MTGISDDLIQKAKNVDVLDYLHTHEPQSIRKSTSAGNEYYLVEHDSLKISNGKFNWFSRGFGGHSALDFLIKVRGMNFVDAVHHLTGDGTIYKTLPLPSAMPDKPFMLPPKNSNNDRAIAYLRGRGIDMDTIKRCIDSVTLYESKRHNCVFVGYDGGRPRFACERGTTDGYKKDVPGSEKKFSFVLPPDNHESRNLAIFESPADALSHATLYKMENAGWDGYRLSLGGVSSIALMSFLERYPKTESVQVCLDYDKPGTEATNRIIRELMSNTRFSHLKIFKAPPPLGKDYNDTLQAVIQQNKHNSRSDRPKEAVSLF